MASVTTAAPPQQSSNDYHYQQNHGSPPYQQPPPPPPTTLQQQQTSVQPTTSGGIPTFQPYLDPTPDTPTMSEDPNTSAHTHDAYTGQQISDESAFTTFATPESSLGQTTRGLNLKYQIFLDRITPHWKARWAFSLTALFIFMARIVLSQGWYVVCYALAIYYLNLFIGFITPKIDPSLNCSEDEEGGPMLPTHANDEFKPFIRRLPEFKFWLSTTQATLISLFLTLFEIFDIPVFWPILLLYFIILTACTMRQQIKHMIKWKYVPWDAGKKKYATKEGGGSSNLYPTTV